MKRETGKNEIIDLVAKHQACNKWLSEIETWKNGIRFIRDLMLRYSSAFKDEDNIVLLRDVHSEVNELETTKVDWLQDKIELYRSQLRHAVKEKQPSLIMKLKSDHNTFKREVANVREEYFSLRHKAYKLIKLNLKKEKTHAGKTLAA